MEGLKSIKPKKNPKRQKKKTKKPSPAVKKKPPAFWLSLLKSGIKGQRCSKTRKRAKVLNIGVSKANDHITTKTQDANPQSDIPSPHQSLKSGLKGHGCFLHL